MTAMIAPALLSIAGLAALAYAWELGFWSAGAPGAGMMPAIAGALLLAANLSDLPGATGERGISVPGRRVAGHLAGLFLLVPLSPLIGMVPALAVLSFAILHFVEQLAATRAAVIAVAAALGSWLLFERLLSVPLPKPMFW
jgi:putative tricarboxylic transport membrane protein